jgi:hypothetical protein
VEMLVLVPLYVILWLCTRYVYDVARAGIEAQRLPRNQVWNVAAHECQGGGDVESLGRIEIEGPLAGYLSKVTSVLEFLEPSVDEGWGEAVRGEKDVTIQRPPALGGTTTRHGAHALFCSKTGTREWTFEQVLKKTCEELHIPDKWCPEMDDPFIPPFEPPEFPKPTPRPPLALPAPPKFPALPAPPRYPALPAPPKRLGLPAPPPRPALPAPPNRLLLPPPTP